MEVLGIDIGGSGIKGAPVDVLTGELTADRHRIATPEPSTPEAVAEELAQMAEHFDWHGPVGCTFPAIVQHGVILTAANVDKSWIGVDAVTLFEKASGCPVRVLNDADAAGLAEMTIGAGKHRSGVVIMLTFGTGIGSAIFVDGHLLPNTEFGHLVIDGVEAEHLASARVRKEEGLGWKKWAERVNVVLAQMEFFFSPDLFIIGGGVSKKYHKFMPYLETRAEIVPAQLLNEAGIIGAAMAARELAQESERAADFTQQVTFLYAADLGATARFYEELLGLELALDQGTCRIYRVGRDAFVGFCRRDNPPATAGVILTLVTHDVDGWHRHLSERGVPFEKAPAYNPTYDIYHCFLRDPNGYLLEIQAFRDPRWPQA